MKVTVYRSVDSKPGAFISYSITGRKDPIVEFYILDHGFLVLGATTTGGYMRRFYKTKAGAKRWMKSYVTEFCRTYWPHHEIEIVPVF